MARALYDEEFRAWLDPWSFESEYERTKQWLAEHAEQLEELRARVNGEKPDGPNDRQN